jgi:hypothetical protein
MGQIVRVSKPPSFLKLRYRGLKLNPGNAFDAVKISIKAGNLGEVELLHQCRVVGISIGQVSIHIQGKDLCP